MTGVPTPPVDLTWPRRIHVIGVGGPGMSAIALVLAGMGHRVSGSEIRDRPVLDRLRASGVEIHLGHDRAVVDGVEVVTASTAIPASNIELDEAARRGIQVVRRAGMLASICAQGRAIAVAGTHGKTTTSSMLMHVLAAAGLRPSFIIGGDVNDVGTGAQWTGPGAPGADPAADPRPWLVVEADESDGTHLELPLHGTILTNVEVDHLDHYGTPEVLFESFATYLAQIGEVRVVCADDEHAARLSASLPRVTYGLGADADVRAVNVVAEAGAMRFEVHRDGQPLGELRLPLRGVHNVLNALGVIAMAAELGVPMGIALVALGEFGGVARRFDVRADLNGATLVDDYAHLPSEIAAVLGAARRGGDGWQRIVAVFQPNRYNRMVDLWPAYADAFIDADLVVLTEIYASGTTPIPGVSGRQVVDAVTHAHPRATVVWEPKRTELAATVASLLRPGDVCISMGCGDIASLPAEIVELVRGGTR